MIRKITTDTCGAYFYRGCWPWLIGLVNVLSFCTDGSWALYNFITSSTFMSPEVNLFVHNTNYSDTSSAEFNMWSCTLTLALPWLCACNCCSCRWDETVSLNCSHQHAYCSSPGWYISMEPWWNSTDRGKPKNLEKIQCHFVRHKSHMDWPQTLPWEVVSNHLSYGTAIDLMFMQRDDDHVDGVRLCLWTAATNETIVYTPGDIWIYEHEEPWWKDIDRGKLLIRSPELSGKPTSSHLVAKLEELAKEIMNLSLWSSFFILQRDLLTYHKIQLGPMALFPSKGRHAADFFTLGRVWTREPWVQLQAH
jgi:hypothetical protein